MLNKVAVGIADLNWTKKKATGACVFVKNDVAIFVCCCELGGIKLDIAAIGGGEQVRIDEMLGAVGFCEDVRRALHINETKVNPESIAGVVAVSIEADRAVYCVFRPDAAIVVSCQIQIQAISTRQEKQWDIIFITAAAEHQLCRLGRLGRLGWPMPPWYPSADAAIIDWQHPVRTGYCGIGSGGAGHITNRSNLCVHHGVHENKEQANGNNHGQTTKIHVFSTRECAEFVLKGQTAHPAKQVAGHFMNFWGPVRLHSPEWSGWRS
jgi:hypothetical protein